MLGFENIFSKENNAKTDENCAMKCILSGIGKGNRSFYEKMISNSLSANSPKCTWLKQNFKNKENIRKLQIKERGMKIAREISLNI